MYAERLANCQALCESSCHVHLYLVLLGCSIFSQGYVGRCHVRCPPSQAATVRGSLPARRWSAHLTVKHTDPTTCLQAPEPDCRTLAGPNHDNNGPYTQGFCGHRHACWYLGSLDKARNEAALRARLDQPRNSKPTRPWTLPRGLNHVLCRP